MLIKIMPWCVLLLWLGFKIHGRFYTDFLKITFFDVGQGDSILVEFPNGKTMLIDAGGGFRDFNIGRRVLFTELTKKGILSLDYALLTHPDQDHGYGFLGLFSEIQIKELWFNQIFQNSDKKLMRNILSFSETFKTKRSAFHKVETRNIHGSHITLYPLQSDGINNSSLVSILEYAGCKIAFTGDIEKPGEELWLKSLLPSVDIMKVPHHGSKTSSSEKLLHVLSPKIGVISVGQHNHYGHPNFDVLNRYLKQNTQTLRTDFHGFIEIKILASGEYYCQSAKGFCGRGKCKGKEG